MFSINIWTRERNGDPVCYVTEISQPEAIIRLTRSRTRVTPCELTLRRARERINVKSLFAPAQTVNFPQPPADRAGMHTLSSAQLTRGLEVTPQGQEGPW